MLIVEFIADITVYYTYLYFIAAYATVVILPYGIQYSWVKGFKRLLFRKKFAIENF